MVQEDVNHTHPTEVTGVTPVKSGTEARQGSQGKPVLYVLVAALALVAVAVVVLVGFTDVDNPPPSIGNQPAVNGPSTDGRPGNAEPSRLDANPQAQPSR